MGFCDSLVVGESAQWLCPICRDVVEDPVETPCEHLYCRRCVTSLPKSECPVCRQPFLPPQLKQPHRLVREQLSRLRLRCVLYTIGCETLLPLSQTAINEHNHECHFVELKCVKSTPSGEQCSVRMMRMELHDHWSKCLYFNVGCNNPDADCEVFVARKDQANHMLSCVRATINCSCGGQYVRMDQERHIAICPETVVDCGENGCPIMLKRKDIHDHRLKCGFVISPCDRCEVEVARNMLNTHDCVKCLRQQIKTLQSNFNKMARKLEKRKRKRQQLGFASASESSESEFTNA
eukprot:GILJ01005498.1.p1 GENE.GILJ01005498.1~~GILJ01005498.1.p1  ORF type:complete len:293 (+),score=4.27 GILJ01005498.1:74-952(+)